MVDHRYPRHLDPDGARHHDWANLFPTCDHCNSRRSRSYPEAGLLSPGDQVERRLEQVADVVAGAPSLACRFSARDPEDRQAEATATELEHLHDPETGQTFRARSRTRELLAAIHLRYARDIYPLERNVRALRRKRAQDQPYAPADLRRAEAALQTALSRRAPFTMLIRSLVGPALADLFD